MCQKHKIRIQLLKTMLYLNNNYRSLEKDYLIQITF